MDGYKDEVEKTGTRWNAKNGVELSLGRDGVGLDETRAGVCGK